MNIPDKFSNRVLRLRKQAGVFETAAYSGLDKLLEKEWPEAYTDVIYESNIVGYQHSVNITHVVVFETTEDALAFKIKYGDKYV